MDNLHNDISVECLAEEQANFCRVFSNARRIQILWALMDRELSVGAVAEAVNSSVQNVSQHLSKMKEYDLVSSRREGRTIYYHVERGAVEKNCLGLHKANNPGN
jgi:DNA-binding transcriptional ArsR family regulator